MRVVGLDIHRVFAEAVMLDDGRVARLGRVGMTREHLEAFARRLTHDDHVVVEATGNATAVAEVIGPHVGRVVIANPRQVRLIAEARIKTDVVDATVLARLYASGFLPEVWVPDQRTLALRRQVTRRNQVVRQRARLKTIIQSVLHAHLVPPCPHADLLGPKGRAWLLGQTLPPDEQDAVARHLREHDRLSEDLRVVEREVARDALADADAKRLMTIPGIDMVVAVGLLAAIGPVARFAGPDKLVAYLGLNPSVHQSGEGRPRHGRITKQGRTHARTMLVEAAWQAVRGPGPLRAFHQRVARRRGNHIAAVAPWRASSRSSSGACSDAAKTTPGCGQPCTPRSCVTSSSARGSRSAVANEARPTPTISPGHGWRRGAGPSRPRRLIAAKPRAGPDEGRGRPQAPQKRSDLEAARSGSHLTPGSSPRGGPWANGR
jgi:transposase